MDRVVLHSTSMGPSGPGASPVVFCHGLFGQGRNWTQVGRALAEHHRVLLVDLPNHGRSGWSERVDYLAMADDVAALLDPDDPVTLVGHSMGGKVAMALALRHPALVQRLCVVDVAPVTYASMSSFAGYVEAMQALDLATLGSRADADAGLVDRVPDPVVRGFLLQNLRRERRPDGEEGWRWQMNLSALGEQLDVLRGWPEPELAGLAAFPGPTAWVAGEHSDYVLPEHDEAMRRWFPRTQLVTVKGAGHWVHSEQPETFLAVLRRVLAR